MGQVGQRFTILLLFGAVSSLLSMAASAQEWRALPGAPVDPQIQDVFFIDERMGWTQADGKMYRTLDGGDTWQSFDTPGMTMRSITFTTPAHGWIGSLNPATPLWASADSGKTWVTIDLPAPRPDGICGLWAVSPDVIYGCGRYWDPEPTVIKTDDGGVTWNSIDMSNLADGLVDCYFFAPDSGFVVGNVITNARVPRILFTGDGGTTWSIRHTGMRLDAAWCWKISFVNRSVGYVSVQTSEFDSHCLKTTDGGWTWVEMPMEATSIEGIGFSTELLGWAANGRFWRTTDGGLTWSRDPFNAAGSVNRIRFLRPDLAYASGRTIYKFSTTTPVRPQTFTQMKQRFRGN